MTDDVNPPWHMQMDPARREPMSAGTGILILSGALLIWLLSLVMRFAEGDAVAAGLTWCLALFLWLTLQVAIARTHVLERVAFLFPTLLQVAAPLIATVIAAFAWPSFGKAMSDVASGVSYLELVAIHALRLAAWGTVAKYRKQQLPRYFFHYGSIPDFAFALLSIALGFLMWMDILVANQSVLVVWSVLGIAVFFGAGISMYFGVETGILGWRWKYVVAKAEPPTLLPFRWPMNLAPAFCVPIFILAHQMMLAKVALS